MRVSIKKVNRRLDIVNDGILSFIKPYVVDKTVIDVGCVNHNLKTRHKDKIWVHDFLCSISKKVIGIDILSKDISKLKKEGYDVICQNAENMSLGIKADVIFAGELIEHLNNPGLFLKSAKNNLKKLVT